MVANICQIRQGTHRCTIPQVIASPARRVNTSSADSEASNHDDQSDCKTCPAGTYAAAPASTECTTCAAGYYLDDPATSGQKHDSPSDCKKCPAGFFSPGNHKATQHDSIEDCTSNCTGAPGTYRNTTGNLTLCLTCPAGRYTNDSSAGGDGVKSCSACPAGRFLSDAAIGAFQPRLFLGLPGVPGGISAAPHRNIARHVCRTNAYFANQHRVSGVPSGYRGKERTSPVAGVKQASTRMKTQVKLLKMPDGLASRTPIKLQPATVPRGYRSPHGKRPAARGTGRYQNENSSQALVCPAGYFTLQKIFTDECPRVYTSVLTGKRFVLSLLC